MQGPRHASSRSIVVPSFTKLVASATIPTDIAIVVEAHVGLLFQAQIIWNAKLVEAS